MKTLGSELLRYKMQGENPPLFCTFDVESESLSLFYSRPWQISFLIWRGDKILEEHDYHLDWKDLNISADAKRITKFNQESFDSKKQDPKKVLNIFNSYLYNENIYNHTFNGINFDFYQIRNAQRQLGLRQDFSYIARTYDSHSLAKANIKGFPVEDDFVAWQYKLAAFHEKGLKTNQIATAKMLGVSISEELAHDGLFDAKIARLIFLKQIWQLDIK